MIPSPLRSSVRKEVVVMGLIAMIVLISMVTTIYTSLQHNDLEDNWVAHTHQVIETLESLIYHIKDAETGERGFLITSDKSYLTLYNTAKNQSYQDFSRLKQLTRDNANQQVSLARFLPFLRTRFAQLDKGIQAYQSGQLVQAGQVMLQARELVLAAPDKVSMDAIRSQVDAMITQEHFLLQRRMENAQQSSQQTRLTLLMGFVAVLGLIGGAFYLVNQEMNARKHAQESLKDTNTHLEHLVTLRTQALQDSEELFRTMAESIPQMAWMTDAEGNIFWYNQRWYDYTGTDFEQMKDWGWTQVHHPNHLAAVVEKFKISLQSGQPWEDTFPLRGKNGDYRWFLSRAQPVRNPQGQIVRWFGSNTDITELLETQETLRQREDAIRKLNESLKHRVEERTAQLVAINRELESFSYSVSHDLRAPLRSIDGFSQALVEDYEDQLDAVGKDFLQRVRLESQRMGHLIDDLLGLSRLTRWEMNKKPVNLSVMVEEIALTLQKLEPNRTGVTFNIQPDLVVDADEHLIQALLQNLVGNAWKFTSHHATALIQFGMQVDDQKRNVYWIKDDGAGFNMAYVDKLFGAFQRLHAMAEFSGTGIGLATVQRIIHRHGGSVWATGGIEQGATFYFTFE